MKALIVFLLFALVVGLKATTDDSPGDHEGIPVCSINQRLCGFVTDSICSNLTVIPDDVAIPEILEIDLTYMQKGNEKSRGRSNLSNDTMSRSCYLLLLHTWFDISRLRYSHHHEPLV